MNLDLKPKFVRSFGRIKSRKLSDHKKDLLANLLPQYSIEQTPQQVRGDEREECHPALVAGSIPYNKIYLEIGFGFGDFLFENAKRNPEIQFIGCEPHLNGVVNLLAKLEKEPLKNIKIFVGDNRLLLEELPNNIFDKIYILNPDPWPKAKHYKRRLINADFLKFLKSKAKNDAELIIATDDNGYKKWIMAEYFKSGLWSWQATQKADWQNFPEDWVKTKYQKKAEESGRENVFLRFR